MNDLAQWRLPYVTGVARLDNSSGFGGVSPFQRAIRVIATLMSEAGEGPGPARCSGGRSEIETACGPW